MRRVVAPERLDDLPATAPQAIRSRGDLRRLNSLMGHVGILTRALCLQHRANPFGDKPVRLVELGAGDGTLLLKLARRWAALGVKAEVTLLDRQNLLSPRTHRAFAALQWPVEVVASDVFTWLESPSPVADVMLANLFLHHFEDARLAALLRLAAAKTKVFLACEPRRSPLALAAARCVALVGANAVTRHDAVISVRAGFAGGELSALWPGSVEWELREAAAGLFSHSFIAKRHA
ncbi:MAG: hypothetical protein RJA22_2653 [Verrucomicrobiota bacterium]